MLAFMRSASPNRGSAFIASSASACASATRRTLSARGSVGTISAMLSTNIAASRRIGAVAGMAARARVNAPGTRSARPASSSNCTRA